MSLFLFALAVGVVVLFVAHTRTIVYERIDSGEYHHQVTVTYYPLRLAAMLGIRGYQEVYVTARLTPGYEDCGWYEIPSLNELSNIGPLSHAIALTIRQQRFEESR